MDEVKVNSSKTVSVDLDLQPDGNEVFVTVYHEFGDIIVGPSLASESSSNVYEFTIGVNDGGKPFLDSAGKYRVDFDYNVSGSHYSRNVYFNVYVPYTNENSFFPLYPELQAGHQQNFDIFERRARAVVNTFCGQSFEPFLDKKLTLNGTNHNVLHLPVPISRLIRVVMNEEEADETVFYDEATGIKTIEKVRQPFNFNSTFFIKFKRLSGGVGELIFDSSLFRENSSYSITGDWGWQYIPDNVSQATILLIADMMNDDSEYRRHGIVSVDMDNIRFSMKSSFYESTGNIDADVLLTDYTLFVMDYII
jgi:hypothetical protein